MRYAAIVGLAMLVFVSSGLAADTARFGMQTFVVFPKGDLGKALNEDVSLEAGAHLDCVISDKSMLRPRVDAAFFASSSTDALAKPVNNLSLGCDYVHFLDPAANLVYGAVGASLVRWNFSDRETSLKPSLRLGLGLRINARVSAEAQYEYSSVLSNWSSKALKIGASFSF